MSPGLKRLPLCLHLIAQAPITLMEQIRSTSDEEFSQGGTGGRLGHIVVVLSGIAALSATLVTVVYEPFHFVSLD